MERLKQIHTLRELDGQLDLSSGWRKVQEAAGMPGVDGLSVAMFARSFEHEISRLRRAILEGDYRPAPLRLLAIQKTRGSSSVRACLVPAVPDRIVQSATAGLLSADFENYFENSSFAYRKGRGVSAALKRIRELQNSGFRWVLRGDVRSFFDSIDHNTLVAGLAKRLGTHHPILSFVMKWVRGPVWDGERLMRISKGIPQGSPLSPVLSNFFLTPFDRVFRSGRCRLIRYGDDFTILARDPSDLPAAREQAEHMLGRLGLNLNVQKTSMLTFGPGFRFIGAQLEEDAIWIRFQPNRFKKPPVWAAPPMPASLLKAYFRNSLQASGDFDASTIRIRIEEDYPVVKRELPFDRLRNCQ